jgi:hypothetical protein
MPYRESPSSTYQAKMRRTTAASPASRRTPAGSRGRSGSRRYPETGVCSAAGPAEGGCGGEDEDNEDDDEAAAPAAARPEPALAAAGAACCG